jgi:hypothetical protein
VLDGVLTGLLEASSVELLERRVALPFSGEALSLSLCHAFFSFVPRKKKGREKPNRTQPQ